MSDTTPNDSKGMLSADVWAAFIETACAVNEYSAPARHHPQAGSGSPAGEDSPGTDFNRRGSWLDTGLFDAGWKWARQTGPDSGLITRPGKDLGVSASIGMTTSKENGWPLFWLWSTSVPDLIPEQPYTRFGLYAALRHSGDFQAAAKELASKGYGRPMPQVPEVKWGTDGATEPTADPRPDRLFLWMSELRHRPENDKWIWHGFLSRGGITLLSALWKAGKSTLLAHLLRNFDGRAVEFLGQPIVPSRVLYVSEEHEEMWADRRDELQIGDHVGMVCRPFKGRPSPAEWTAFVGKVAQAVVDFRFDLVVMDTISKLWPVREENDAGQVEDALMPLWTITGAGAALMLVHHNRKSDGKEFTGARGSGGLPAFMETLIEFRRNTDSQKDPKRVITAAGRYKETPDKLLIELTPAGYVSHGDPDKMTPDQKAELGVGNQDTAERWKVVALGSLPEDPDKAMDIEAIQTALRNHQGQKVGVRDDDIREWLKSRINDGEVERIGSGKRNDKFRYYRVGMNEPTVRFDPPDSSPSPVKSREENPGEEMTVADQSEQMGSDSPPGFSSGNLSGSGDESGDDQ